ncbi:MAG: D-aminoacyl-tRNA deacylase, partial [Spirochaetaceae bacterium]
MRAVVQRVTDCSVVVDGETSGALDRGILVYLGISTEDGQQDVRYVAEKAANLRIFEDEAGKMNRSVLDIGGGACVVSQFTLYG